jgi:glucose/arabinose dehydrogenase
VFFYIFVLFFVALPGLRGAALPPGFVETAVIPGVLSRASAMAFTPDGRILVCEQSGALRVIKNGVLLPTPFATLNVASQNEQGLVGVAVDPNFATNQYVYVTYTANTVPVRNRVSRFTANGDVAAGGETILITLDPVLTNTHLGGAIHFGPDGKLYVATGDAGMSGNSQSLGNTHGKILRFNPDGTIPNDNPFFYTTNGNNSAIWAYGLRNPFTFAFQPGTGRMYINDVGEQTWEEINEGVAGANYGWPITEGPTTNPQFRSPIHAYGHDQDQLSTGCSIIGGAFYNPAINRYPASFTGKYFYADFCAGWIRTLDPVTRETQIFATGYSLPVQVAVGPDGFLYVLDRGARTVYRIGYQAGYRTPTAVYRSDSLNVYATASNSKWGNLAGGIVAGGPASAQDSAGNTYAVSIDPWSAVWMNVLDATTQQWDGWRWGGGTFQGVPAIAVASNGVAYVVGRDLWGNYWIGSFTRAGGFGSWMLLAGVLESDPAVAAAPDGSLYIVGRDIWGAVWSNRFVPGSGAQGWRSGGGVIQGKPSVTVGADGVAYVAVRDLSGGLWLARIAGDNWLGWTFGGGVAIQDPVIVAGGNGMLYPVVLGVGGAVAYRPFTEGSSNGWQSWVGIGGVFQSISAAAAGGTLHIAGRDPWNGVWWYRSNEQFWRYNGQNSLVGGDLSASPR